MTKLLQNHTNRRDFPVDGWALVWPIIYQRDWKTLSQRNSNIQVAIYKILLWLIIPWVLLVLFSIDSAAKDDIFQAIPYLGLSPAKLFMWILPAAILLMTLWFIQGPKREQLRYYKETGAKFLPLEKRLALRLNIVQSFDYGFWSETLEYYPLQLNVKDPSSYKWLILATPESGEQMLKETWGVNTRDEFYEMVERLFAGMHTPHFAEDITREDNDTLIDLLSYLTKIPEEKIKQSAYSQNSRPPALIWAFDLWRVIPMTNNALAFGIINEDDAWELLLKVADLVHELFPSFDDFHESYRLGNAYWSQSADMTEERLRNFHRYKNSCDWPIAKLPWPAPKGVELNDAMRTGKFASLS